MKSVVVDVLVGWIKIWDKSMAWLRELFHIVVYRNEQGQMQCIVPAYNNHNFLGLINDLIRINKYELYFFTVAGTWNWLFMFTQVPVLPPEVQTSSTFVTFS